MGRTTKYATGNAATKSAVTTRESKTAGKHQPLYGITGRKVQSYEKARYSDTRKSISAPTGNISLQFINKANKYQRKDKRERSIAH